MKDFKQKNILIELGVVVHTCNSSTCDAEARRLRVQGLSGLHRETLSKERGGGRGSGERNLVKFTFHLKDFSKNTAGLSLNWKILFLL
jgi:hypothetical protein